MLLATTCILLFSSKTLGLNVDYTKYLQTYGYLPRGNNLISGERFRIGVKQMQHMTGLEETGELDERTLRLMQVPRCGVPDVGNGFSRAKRYIDDRRRLKWGKKRITYTIKRTGYNGPLSMDNLRRASRRAADQWSELADIEIVEIADEKNAMMKISAGTGRHFQCHYPFDSKTLGHAFLPESGEIHINDEVKYAMTDFTESYGKDSLYAVVAHEMGHAIGLDHNKDPASVMFGINEARKFEYTTKDREMLQQLYGRKRSTSPKPQPTKPNIHVIPRRFPPSSETEKKREEWDEIKPDECRVENPVIVLYRNEYLIFKSLWVWRVSSDFKRLIAKPQPIHNMFNGLPGPIDAAVNIGEDLWVFVDHRVFIINGYRILHSPFHLSELGIKSNSIDLAYEWHYFNPPAIYTWKDEKYWKLDEAMHHRRVDERYPKNIDLNWENVPRGVKSAFTYEKEIHFIRGDQVYRMNSSRSTFDIGDDYPKPLRDFFKFCPPLDSKVSTSASSSFWFSGCYLLLIPIVFYVFFNL